MKLLAIDTTSSTIGLSLMEGGEILTEYVRDAKLTHSKILVQTVDRILSDTGWEIRQIEKICVTTGPGSFTGIRIGLTYARTLSQFLKIKVVGVVTLDVLAEDVPKGDYLVIPLIDALNGRVFAAKYEGKTRRRISEYMLCDIENILSRLRKKRVVFVGNGLLNKKICELIGKTNSVVDFPYYRTKTFPRPAVLAKIGNSMKGAGYKDLMPFYLKP